MSVPATAVLYPEEGEWACDCGGADPCAHVVAAAAAVAGAAGMAVAGLCVVIYLPILIIVGGMIETWVMAAWTLTYKQLTGRAPASVVPAPLPG